MDDLGQLGAALRSYLPLLAALAGSALALGFTHTLFRLRERRTGPGVPLARQVAMLAVTALGVVVVVLALPTSEALKGQLLGLLGIAFTGAVAFSSTTFVGNAMAGLMIRAVGNFRPGDWVMVGEEFGRVTERGLFHTEIQTEDRDLATLPNLYLVTHPVRVVRESGTIVSTSLSLGYDLDHHRIEALLAEAARACDLEDPFVQILELGDFSVTYRVAGFLADVKTLLSVRSHLRARVLDTLHGAGVEIVSPTFMNQRRLAEGARIIPAPEAEAPGTSQARAPEEIIFDKAEQMASREEMRGERTRLLAEIEKLEKSRGEGEASEQERVAREIETRRARAEAIAARLRAVASADDAEADG